MCSESGGDNIDDDEEGSEREDLYEGEGKARGSDSNGSGGECNEGNEDGNSRERSRTQIRSRNGGRRSSKGINKRVSWSDNEGDDGRYEDAEGDESQLKQCQPPAVKSTVKSAKRACVQRKLQQRHSTREITKSQWARAPAALV
jgi:hypothetical protein